MAHLVLLAAAAALAQAQAPQAQQEYLEGMPLSLPQDMVNAGKAATNFTTFSQVTGPWDSLPDASGVAARPGSSTKTLRSISTKREANLPLAFTSSDISVSRSGSGPWWS
eukprot:Skav222398  [mRNA]  locus=scaffold4422:293448:294357:+ [translate_table: standard]